MLICFVGFNYVPKVAVGRKIFQQRCCLGARLKLSVAGKRTTQMNEHVTELSERKVYLT